MSFCNNRRRIAGLSFFISLCNRGLSIYTSLAPHVLWQPAPDEPGCPFTGAGVTMPSQNVSNQEPIGIVISCGKRDEPLPTVWAYIWGAVPEREVPIAEQPKAVA